MGNETSKEKYCQRRYVYSKATCSIISLILLSTILWILGCEILWHGSTWIENIFKTKNEYYVYKTIGLILLLSLGFLIVVIAISIVLFGIPFTIVHVDHLFNRNKLSQLNSSTINSDQEQNQNSKQATRWTISILILVLVGLVIGAAGCEVIQYSGLNFKALSIDNNQNETIEFYFRQCLFLSIMFSGLLLFFVGFLLAPFTLAFAGIVSFDKKNNSYRLRPRRRQQTNRTHNIIIEI